MVWSLSRAGSFHKRILKTKKVLQHKEEVTVSGCWVLDLKAWKNEAMSITWDIKLFTCVFCELNLKMEKETRLMRFIFILVRRPFFQKEGKLTDVVQRVILHFQERVLVSRVWKEDSSLFRLEYGVTLASGWPIFWFYSLFIVSNHLLLLIEAVIFVLLPSHHKGFLCFQCGRAALLSFIIKSKTQLLLWIFSKIYF